MDNKTNKPKLTSHQLVKKMEIEKGIQFKYTSEAEAENYLSNINNYLRTAAYRKNFQCYRNGPNIGKYIHLDFAYLQELSTIDMHFRFLISKMCLDIEHNLKVPVLPLLRVICYINILLLHVRHISIESQPLMIVLSGYC